MKKQHYQNHQPNTNHILQDKTCVYFSDNSRLPQV